ncbi:MAG: type II secretion system protein F [Halieaceae bacterium]|nr:type II secretion system protein F [Halieaceae bacterium]MDG1932318.1 type II secretion system F family protein [Luminiphilus sp.]MDG2038738.1 type II secretion system F family protein [Luminiphilus sp.]RZO79300.1 MAG: type II secretion system F family protein [Halieaceae bacterium]
MAIFEYRASDQGGSLHQGVETASDLQSAARALRARGLTPIVLTPNSAGAVSQATDNADSNPKTNLIFNRTDTVSSAQVLRLTSELSVLLHAGLPLDRALKIQIDTAEPGALKLMAEDILKTIKSGRAFTVALDQYPGVFSSFYVSMVRSGEASGNLAGVLSELSVYLERSKAVRSTVVSALVYPAILAVVATLSVAIMLGFVVPEFESIFDEMGDGLPMLTQFIIVLGDVVSAWWWLMLGGIIAVSHFAKRWVSTPEGRAAVDSKLLNLPIAGPLLRKFEISRFARTMGTLLSNGVAILKAVDIARGTVSNALIKEHLAGLEPAVKRGERLSKAMQPDIFSPMAIQMVLVGEESGRLDTMLIELAQVYEAEVESDVKRALTLLEPALILGMGGVIAVIIMGILMGILSVNTMAF